MVPVSVRLLLLLRHGHSDEARSAERSARGREGGEFRTISSSASLKRDAADRNRVARRAAEACRHAQAGRVVDLGDVDGDARRADAVAAAALRSRIAVVNE